MGHHLRIILPRTSSRNAHKRTGSPEHTYRLDRHTEPGAITALGLHPIDGVSMLDTWLISA